MRQYKQLQTCSHCGNDKVRQVNTLRVPLNPEQSTTIQKTEFICVGCGKVTWTKQ